MTTFPRQCFPYLMKGNKFPLTVFTEAFCFDLINSYSEFQCAEHACASAHGSRVFYGMFFCNNPMFYPGYIDKAVTRLRDFCLSFGNPVTSQHPFTFYFGERCFPSLMSDRNFPLNIFTEEFAYDLINCFSEFNFSDFRVEAPVISRPFYETFFYNHPVFLSR